MGNLRASGSVAETRDTTPGYDAAFTDLSQIIAHRMRSLTSSIESCADMLSEVLDGREERELVLRILEGTARIEYVLSDLMLYGRPIQPMFLPLYVDEVLDGVVSLLSAGERQRTEIRMDTSEPVRISADPNLMRQALLAVVQNALDAVERGSDASGNVRIDIRMSETAVGPEVVIAVGNPGATGVDDASEVLFRPFFTTKAQNLGLGLSIARRIVRAHEGRLELTQDNAEKGTCFELALPVDCTVSK